MQILIFEEQDIRIIFVFPPVKNMVIPKVIANYYSHIQNNVTTCVISIYVQIIQCGEYYACCDWSLPMNYREEKCDVTLPIIAIFLDLNSLFLTETAISIVQR